MIIENKIVNTLLSAAAIIKLLTFPITLLYINTTYVSHVVACN